MAYTPALRSDPDFFAGEGEARALMRRHDWSRTAIGTPDAWPVALRTLVDVILGSNEPMFVVWGCERTLLYNEPYSGVVANKHPATGCDFLNVWREIRADLAPLVERAYAGEATRMDDIELIMERKGYPEITHWTYSYTPVRGDDGAVSGFLCTCHEITHQCCPSVARPEGAHLRHGAAPSLPAAYNQAIDGIAIGPDVGSCGSAAFRNVPVFASDIANDPLWANFRDLALEHGLRACWSIPVRSAQGALLGTFAMYHCEPREPQPADLELVDFVVRTAGLVIERARAEASSRSNEERLRLATENAEVGFWDVDEVNQVLHWPPIVKAMFGMGADVPTSMADFYAGLHPEDAAATAQRYAAAADPARRALYDVEYRTIGKEDGVVRWVAAKAAVCSTRLVVASGWRAPPWISPGARRSSSSCATSTRPWSAAWPRPAPISTAYGATRTMSLSSSMATARFAASTRRHQASWLGRGRDARADGVRLRASR